MFLPATTSVAFDSVRFARLTLPYSVVRPGTIGIVKKIHHQWAFRSMQRCSPANGFDPQLWINYHLQNNKWFANDLQAVLLWALMMVCAERGSNRSNVNLGW